MIVFNLSIMDTLGHSKTVLIIEVSIMLVALIIEVSLSVHNSRFDCTTISTCESIKLHSGHATNTNTSISMKFASLAGLILPTEIV